MNIFQMNIAFEDEYFQVTLLQKKLNLLLKQEKGLPLTLQERRYSLVGKQNRRKTCPTSQYNEIKNVFSNNSC
jgi:hypothetical protein